MLDPRRPINQSDDDDDIPPPDEGAIRFIKESEDPEKRNNFDLEDGDDQ